MAKEGAKSRGVELPRRKSITPPGEEPHNALRLKRRNRHTPTLPGFPLQELAEEATANED